MRTRFPFVVILFILVTLCGCTINDPAGVLEPIRPNPTIKITPTGAPPPTILPTATAIPEPTVLPTATVIPEPTSTLLPIASTSTPTGLDGFMTQLENALQSRDVEMLVSLMSDPFSSGAWRSEWRTIPARDAAAEIITEHLPEDNTDLFSDLSVVDISTLLDGQNPQQMLGPDMAVASVIHGPGWGKGNEEVILFIVQSETGEYAWHAFLYVPDTFQPEQEIWEYPPLDSLVITSTESLSPDGLWTATFLESEVVDFTERSEFYNALVVSNGEKTWEPDGGWRGYGLGAEYLAIYRWSEDGKSLYYGNSVSVDGCGLFPNFVDLYQLDLTNGKVSEILSPNLTLTISLSPDESRLAYIGTENAEPALLVLSIENGETTFIPLTGFGTNTQAGNITWSPDSRELVLTLAHNPCSPEWTHSILLIDPAGSSLMELIERDSRRFTIRAWPTTNAVILEDDVGQNWHLDVVTGNLSSVP